MDGQELAKGLSELGGLIWRAIHADDKITELLFGNCSPPSRAERDNVCHAN
jgi:hypothetical protein